MNSGKITHALKTQIIFIDSNLVNSLFRDKGVEHDL